MFLVVYAIISQKSKAGIYIMRALLLHAPFGSGHKKAAEATGKALTQISGDIEVKVVDTLTLANPLFRWISVRSFAQIVKRAPSVWGYFYETTDDRKYHETTHKFLERTRSINLKKFIKLISDWNPDVIICTHWLPLHLLERIKEQTSFSWPIYVILTDYTLHKMLLAQNVDRYFVPNDKVAAELAYAGIPSSRITVSGIPVDTDYLARMDGNGTREGLGLEKDIFTILILSLWTDEDLAVELIKILDELTVPCQYIFVAGVNKKLSAAVKRMQLKKPHAVLGWISNMPEIMACSDVVVGKAGGLIVSETLSLNKPMVIINPMPGQEERNSDYILEIGAGTKIYHPKEIEYVMFNLINNKAYYDEKAKSCFTHAKPRAALEIAESVYRDYRDRLSLRTA